MKYVFMSFYIVFAVVYIFLFGNMAMTFPAQSQISQFNETTYSMNFTGYNSSGTYTSTAGIYRPPCSSNDAVCLTGYLLSLSNVASEYLFINMVFISLTLVFMFIMIVDIIIPLMMFFAELIPF